MTRKILQKYSSNKRVELELYYESGTVSSGQGYSLSRYFDPVQDLLLTFLDEVTEIVTSM
jgi:hypothetical protein